MLPVKIEVTIPATLVCLLPWILNGLPTNDMWFIAFIICIAIDITVHFNKKKV